MDKRRKIQTGREFNRAIQQNRRREENSKTIEGNKSKVIIQKIKQREDRGKSKNEISDEHSVLKI